MKESSAYNKLASVYSHLMRKVRYSDWAEYIYSISERYVDRDASVLELAGGNCNLANYLSAHYPNIIVSDQSKQMLKTDEVKILPKVCCDMTLLPFKTKFDFIYSTFDSVNYLTSKRKLYNLFREVEAVLEDTGIFTFDASLERNSYTHIKQPVRRGVWNNIDYVHRTLYNDKTKIHRNIFEIKFDDGSVFKEIHKQKIYQFEEYFNLIEKAGLFVIECLETFTYRDAKATSERAQFILAHSGTSPVRREFSSRLKRRLSSTSLSKQRLAKRNNR